MLGWQIFKHSFNMVTRNFGKALHIWAVPWVIAVVLIVILALALGVSFDSPTFDSAGEGLFVILAVIVVIGAALWIAVAWHRYILLSETPSGILPPIHQDRMLAYLGRGFILFLVFLLAGSVLFGLVAGLAALIMPLGIILGLIAGVALTVLFYRLSVTLPAAALGQPLTLKEALAATKGSTGVVIVIILCLFVLQLVIQGAVMILTFIPLLGALVSIAVSMFTAMLGISILTTLYGYYIEKRELG